jgi:hypothetical protein
MARQNVGFTFYLIFYTIQRCLIGSLPMIKQGALNMTRKYNASLKWNITEFTSAEKSTRVSLTVEEHTCVFL